MQVLGLAVQEGVPEPADKLKGFRADHHLTYPLLSDEAGDVANKFEVEAIPVTIILDRHRHYVKKVDTVEEIVATVKKLK